MNSQALQWLQSRDTGTSSKAILFFLESERVKPRFSDYPSDPSDLGRCIRLLYAVPLYRQRLNEMREASPVWAQLVDHWDELVALYNEELPNERAPKCYARMRELIQAAGKGG